MILYRTGSGWILKTDKESLRLPAHTGGALSAMEDLEAHLTGIVESGVRPADGWTFDQLLPPIENQEVWAAGVTYSRSRTARMDESQSSGGGDFYDRVYTAERPELFFKAVPRRVVGPGQKVRIRADAKWNVPEPEFTLLISPKGKILGYTIGNDMSSRDIEGENPLYLPQAKVYDGSCAIGPGILVTSEPLSPGTKIQIEIRRGGKAAFAGATALSEMKRDFRTLVDYLYRETSFPDGCLLMTGTGVVPPDEFTLDHGDEISITVDGIGTLQNTVE
jgi:2-dehydro-3-deoxy-D-arabinonate dehydratase